MWHEDILTAENDDGNTWSLEIIQPYSIIPEYIEALYYYEKNNGPVNLTESLEESLVNQ